MNVGLDEIKVTKKATGLFELTHNEKWIRAKIKATSGTNNSGLCKDKFMSPFTIKFILLFKHLFNPQQNYSSDSLSDASLHSLSYSLSDSLSGELKSKSSLIRFPILFFFLCICTLPEVSEDDTFYLPW